MNLSLFVRDFVGKFVSGRVWKKSSFLRNDVVLRLRAIIARTHSFYRTRFRARAHKHTQICPSREQHISYIFKWNGKRSNTWRDGDKQAFESEISIRLVLHGTNHKYTSIELHIIFATTKSESMNRTVVSWCVRIGKQYMKSILDYSFVSILQHGMK